MHADRPEALSRRETLDDPATGDLPRSADSPRREAGSTAELNHRLDALPDGHPASRYEADGTLRHPPVRLSDLDTGLEEDPANPDDGSHDGAGGVQVDRDGSADPDASRPADIRPFTDAEWADHITDVRDRLGEATSAGLATELQYTIGQDKKEWNADRNRIQGALVAYLYAQAKDVPCDGKAIIAGGLGGAGKTTILSEHADIDRSQYLTINPDNIKEEMARRGLIPEVGGLSPMEASDLVHEESSSVAKRLAVRAVADGKNLIWDITMSTLKSTQTRINDLRTAGYAVDGIFVDIPVDTSINRTEVRHREGHEAYRVGIGLGGRYVPPEVIKAQVDPDWGSTNRKTFERVNHLFDHWSRYDNSVDGRSPLLIQSGAPIDSNQEEIPK